MKNNNKIAIVSASLGVGGAERFAGLLSLMLEDLDYEVHHIIILDHVDYDFKGKLVNLGKLFAKDKGIFRGIKKGKYIAKYLHENDIQMVIDNRSRPTIIRELFTKWIYGNRKTYYFFHSSNLEMYLTNSVFFAKKETGCCSLDSINDARAVAVRMGFHHFIVDIREEFGDYVIDNFVDEYIAGRTPNPCVLCNTHIKWSSLLKRADAMDCEFIATGHYARVRETNGTFELLRGLDAGKDQIGRARVGKEC